MWTSITSSKLRWGIMILEHCVYLPMSTCWLCPAWRSRLTIYPAVEKGLLKEDNLRVSILMYMCLAYIGHTPIDHIFG